MSAALVFLSVGASLGVGAVSVPVLGSVLSKPITGETVPTRIVDLGGYLMPDASAKGLAGFEDETSQTSFGSPDTAPTTNAPPSGGPKGTTPAKATADQKRMLAVASFGGGLVIAFSSFILIRRLMRP